jgi:hypothetical protein
MAFSTAIISSTKRNGVSTGRPHLRLVVDDENARHAETPYEAAHAQR